MNITLRKANAVQNSINEAIRSIKMTTSIELNEFQNVEAEIKKANDALMANDTRRQKLLLALYNIRGLVGQANAVSGIDTNLAKAAFVDKRIAQLQEIADLTALTAVDVIKGKIEKIKVRPADARVSVYGYNDTVSTAVVSQEQIDQAKAEILNLKKSKQKLNDEVLEANIKTEIPLSEDVVQTLQAEGLL
jgi:predicted amino acid dehydrogenase